MHGVPAHKRGEAQKSEKNVWKQNKTSLRANRKATELGEKYSHCW